MTESKPKKDPRSSLKAQPPTFKLIKVIQDSMKDPDTLDMPSKERVVELAVELLARSRGITKYAPIRENSHDNPLIFPSGSQIIQLRPDESDLKEWAEKLVAILRSDNVTAIQKITEGIGLFFEKLEEKPDVGISQPKDETTPRRVGETTKTRGGLVPIVRGRTKEVD